MQLVNRRDSPVTGCSLGPDGGGCGGEVGGSDGSRGEVGGVMEGPEAKQRYLLLTLTDTH